MSDLKNLTNEELLEYYNLFKQSGKRAETVRKFGYDVKFAYHCVRLLDEIEQILNEGDLDLQRNREQLKAIRRGYWDKDHVIEYFEKKEKELESLYLSSKLQHSPDEGKIKQLLIDCLEEFFGDLSSAIVIPNQTENLIKDLEDLIRRYK